MGCAQQLCAISVMEPDGSLCNAVCQASRGLQFLHLCTSILTMTCSFSDRDFLQLFLVQLNKIFSLLWCVTTDNWAEHSDCICNNDILNIDVKTEDSLLAGNQFLANTATRVVTLHSLHWRQERGHKTQPSLLANTLPTVVLVWITIILTDHRAHPLYRMEKLL